MTELNLLLHEGIKSTGELSQLVSTILVWIQGLGSLGASAFIAIYIIATVALIPGSLLTLGAGLIFGVVWGSIYVLAGAIVGETCAFLLGRYLLRDWVEKKISDDRTFLALDRALKRSGLKIILLTRLAPIFPFSLLNYAFGVTGISLKDYFLGSIGMIPMTIVYVYFGSLAGDLTAIDTASQLAPELQWTVKIIGAIATIVCTLYVTRLARQALEQSLAEV